MTSKLFSIRAPPKIHHFGFSFFFQKMPKAHEVALICFVIWRINRVQFIKKFHAYANFRLCKKYLFGSWTIKLKSYRYLCKALLFSSVAHVTDGLVRSGNHSVSLSRRNCQELLWRKGVLEILSAIKTCLKTRFFLAVKFL